MTAEWKGRSVESHARRFLILACTYYFNGFRSSQSVNQLFLPVGGWEITTQQSSRAESVTGVLHLELFILRRCIDCRGQQDNLTTAYHPPSPLLKSLRARLMDMANCEGVFFADSSAKQAGGTERCHHVPAASLYASNPRAGTCLSHHGPGSWCFCRVRIEFTITLSLKVRSVKRYCSRQGLSENLNTNPPDDPSAHQSYQKKELQTELTSDYGNVCLRYVQ